jgi:hypothetical protein
MDSPSPYEQPSPKQLNCSQTHTCFHKCGHFVTETDHDLDCLSFEANSVCYSFLVASPSELEKALTIQHAKNRCPWCQYDHEIPKTVSVHDTRAYNFRRSDPGWDTLPKRVIARRADFWKLDWKTHQKRASIEYLKNLRFDIWHVLGSEEVEFQMWRDEIDEEAYWSHWEEVESCVDDDDDDVKEELDSGSKDIKGIPNKDPIDYLITKLENQATVNARNRITRSKHWNPNVVASLLPAMPKSLAFGIEPTKANPNSQAISASEKLKASVDLINDHTPSDSHDELAYSNDFEEVTSCLYQEREYLKELFSDQGISDSLELNEEFEDIMSAVYTQLHRDQGVPENKSISFDKNEVSWFVGEEESECISDLEEEDTAFIPMLL